MPFAVLPALIPDIASVYSVYFAAFADDPVTQALFPNATKEELLNEESEFRKTHTAHVLSYWHTCTTQYTLKCIDTTSGAIVGLGLLDVYPTPSDWKRSEGIVWLSGAQRARAEALVSPLWAAREKLWNEERYVYNHVTAVHPDYQRRGIGRKITEYGMKIAEQAGLPVYLESSKAGVGLYESLGFRRLEEKVVHKKQDIGGDDDYQVPLMVWVRDGRGRELPEAVKFA